MINEYIRADIYDLDNSSYTSDLPFYLTLASTRVRPEGCILELGCGTGRVAIPLAEEGFKVFALDYSIHMLREAQKNADIAGVSKNIFRIRGDMCHVALADNTCDLVLVPFNSFQQILTKERQNQALKTAKRVLKKGGFFLAELSMPTLRKGQLVSEKTTDLDGGNKSLRRVMSSSCDTETQVITRTFEYIVTDKFGSETVRENRNYCNIYPAQWEAMLETAGFYIESKYGALDFTDFCDASKKMLFLCRKA